MWKLATVDMNGGSAALLLDGELLDLLAVAERYGGPANREHRQQLQILEVLERWDEWLPFLQTVDAMQGAKDDNLRVRGTASLLAPVLYPRKAVFAGANYRDHTAEMGAEVPDKSITRPFFFLKPPTTCIIGPRGTVMLPRGAREVDWEVELAVVIGNVAKNVSRVEASKCVAGYTIVIDISARDLIKRSDWPQPVFKTDWIAGKGFDTSAPMGPYLVPQSALGDPAELGLKLAVNGKTYQESNTRELIFQIDELIQTLSTLVTLEPGDVIGTGTPAGVGASHGIFLSDGDVIEAEIEGIGKLEVFVGADSEGTGTAQERAGKDR